MEYCLITGATSGIGYALAKVFAEHGYGLILVSSDFKHLKDKKYELNDIYDVPILIYEQDLSELKAAECLYARLKKEGVDISILVNNAGIGLVGRSETIDLYKDEKLMILNMITPTQLCKLFISDRKRGRILNVSSIGAFQPGPYTAAYYASKAYLLSYSRAIRYEADKNIHICTLCPGSTATPFFEKIGKPVPMLALSAEKVAQLAYKGLMKDKEIIIPGVMNKLMRWIPIKIKMAVIARMKADNKRKT